MSDLTELRELASSALNRFRLDNRVAVVVGGTQGLGQAMALALAAAGADVCVVGVGSSGFQETAAAINSLGRRGTSLEADVTDEGQTERMVAFMLDTYGRIDILVNSQGVAELHPAAEFDIQAWQRVMDVNLKSVFLCCKHVGRVMLQQHKGKIINVSSVRSFQGKAAYAAYAPSKGAVNQLTRTLAVEWGAGGVNVNAIAPVFTRTAMNAPLLADPATSQWVLGRIPMQRIGELDDLFGPVVFLASEASDFVNGHILVVDGGWLAA
jgi:2-dehydro-3-deoxy-D-gluconate 5-dehydrogenase